MSDLRTAFAELAAHPEWFVHQLDVAGARALLVRLEPTALRQAAFVDERVLDGRRDGAWVPLAELLERAPPAQAPAHAIFHLGHCGSTLLSRQLDQLPQVLGLREPLVLRTLAELYEELPQPTARWSPAQWQHAFDRLRALLLRRPPGIARVLVKATSSCNALIEPWLERDPDARVVLLGVPLADYLATILKSGAARADAARFAPARLASLHRQLGDDTIRLHALAPAEQLALGWIAEQARYRAAHARFGARVLRLQFDALLLGRELALAEVAAHFGLEAPAVALARAFAPAVSGRYAKATEHHYDHAARLADLAESRRRFAPELEQGLRYAERLLAATPPLAAAVGALR
jgi:hypothetical protein